MKKKNLNKIKLLFFIFVLESMISLGKSNSETIYMASMPFCLTSIDLGLFQVIHAVFIMYVEFTMHILLCIYCV